MTRAEIEQFSKHFDGGQVTDESDFVCFRFIHSKLATFKDRTNNKMKLMSVIYAQEQGCNDVAKIICFDYPRHETQLQTLTSGKVFSIGKFTRSGCNPSEIIIQRFTRIVLDNDAMVPFKAIIESKLNEIDPSESMLGITEKVFIDSLIVPAGQAITLKCTRCSHPMTSIEDNCSV